MSSNSSSAASRPQGLVARYLKLTDSNITRMTKILGTTSTLDTFLLTLTYTLHLVHSGLVRVGALRLQAAASALAKDLALKAEDALLPGETLIATIEAAPTSRLVRAEQSTKALSGLIDDFRMFLRLRGLLNIWAWGAAVLRRPNADAVLHRIACTQVAACAVFQALENAAYLAGKGVFALEPKKIGKAYIWSARMWMLHVVLDFVRLARVRQLRLRKAEATGDEKDAKVTKAEIDTWWREFYVNMAWMPLTVHWSMPGGYAGEGLVATLGGLAGWIGLTHAWKNTA